MRSWFKRRSGTARNVTDVMRNEMDSMRDRMGTEDVVVSRGGIITIDRVGDGTGGCVIVTIHPTDDDDEEDSEDIAIHLSPQTAMWLGVRMQAKAGQVGQHG